MKWLQVKVKITDKGLAEADLRTVYNPVDYVRSYILAAPADELEVEITEAGEGRLSGCTWAELDAEYLYGAPYAETCY